MFIDCLTVLLGWDSCAVDEDLTARQALDEVKGG